MMNSKNGLHVKLPEESKVQDLISRMTNIEAKYTASQLFNFQKKMWKFQEKLSVPFTF